MIVKPVITFELSRQFLAFLKDNRKEILQIWKKRIRIDKQTDNYELVQFNGNLMFELITELLSGRLKNSDVQQLAEKVASERAIAQVNLGDFIFNVYQGRTVLLEQISYLNPSVEDFMKISEAFSLLFDQFVHDAVSKYSELKDNEIHEKLLFIKDTHKDRLTILGQMSSSFVHEFRNPLTAIMGFFRLIRSGDHTPMYFEVIEHELQELNYRITRFLHTSKIKTEEESFQPVSINELIKDLLNFLYPTLVSEGIRVDTHVSFTGHIEGKFEELKQVLLNLFMNAIEAVKLNRNDPYIKVTSELKGESIKIGIENNGPIIPEHTLNTIFEPFYTTKELGTGIGLYVCKQIIEAHHNGKITCQSDDNSTCFMIDLPFVQSSSTTPYGL